MKQKIGIKSFINQFQKIIAVFGCIVVQLHFNIPEFSFYGNQILTRFISVSSTGDYKSEKKQ